MRPAILAALVTLWAVATAASQGANAAALEILGQDELGAAATGGKAPSSEGESELATKENDAKNRIAALTDKVGALTEGASKAQTKIQVMEDQLRITSERAAKAESAAQAERSLRAKLEDQIKVLTQRAGQAAMSELSAQTAALAEKTLRSSRQLASVQDIVAQVAVASGAVAFTLGGTKTNYPGYGCLSGANDVKLKDVDLAGCETACINDSSCKSIDFYVGKNTCSISYSDFGDVGKTSSTSDCRFYEIDRSAVSSEVTNLGPDDQNQASLATDEQASSDSGGTASETSATGAQVAAPASGVAADKKALTSIALSSMTVGNTKMCLGQHPDACPVTDGQQQYKSQLATIRKLNNNKSGKHVVQCPGDGNTDDGAARCANSQISTISDGRVRTTGGGAETGGGLKALVNLKREMTFLDDGGRNCLCDPYVQVNALKPEIVTQVVLDIPGKQVCDGVHWWKQGGAANSEPFFKVNNYGANYDSSVIGQPGISPAPPDGTCHGGCLQPFITSSFLRVALHYRASEDGDWTEYGPSFFFHKSMTRGLFTMELDSAITAKQLRMVMVCTDSAGPAAFPTSFTGWGNCTKPWQCDDDARLVKVALKTGITYFNWDDEVRGLIKETLEKSAPLLLGDTHGDTASDSSPVAAGSFGNNAAVDCDAVNNATHPLGKVLDQHFRGWQTPGDGKFAQEPHEHDPPETITLDNGKQWHVVASKRNKGKGIFLVEKRLVCFREVDSDTKVQKPMVCCVKKGFKVTAESNPAALTLRQNMTKAAILRNF